jgi:hypothetical protein
VDIGGVPLASSPAYAKAWFLENYYEQSEGIIKYVTAIINSSFSTDRFLPTPPE